MQKREGRSHVPPLPEPSRTGRKRRERHDIGRDEVVTRLDVVASLPPAARRDLQRGALDRNEGRGA